MRAKRLRSAVLLAAAVAVMLIARLSAKCERSAAARRSSDLLEPARKSHSKHNKLGLLRMAIQIGFSGHSKSRSRTSSGSSRFQQSAICFSLAIARLNANQMRLALCSN